MHNQTARKNKMQLNFLAQLQNHLTLAFHTSLTLKWGSSCPRHGLSCVEKLNLGRIILSKDYFTDKVLRDIDRRHPLRNMLIPPRKPEVCSIHMELL